jgi:hypothetical protein
MHSVKVTKEQIKRIATLLIEGSKVQQNGDNVLVDSKYTHYIGSMSDGDIELVGITYEVRSDGKMRVVSKCKPKSIRNPFHWEGVSHCEKQWH